LRSAMIRGRSNAALRISSGSNRRERSRPQKPQCERETPP
jgi:hypothetical protein